MSKYASKPHIRQIAGLWRCTTWVNEGTKYRVVTGYGYGPEEAYKDWRQKWTT